MDFKKIKKNLFSIAFVFTLFILGLFIWSPVHAAVITDSGISYTSTLDSLTLKMDVAYDNSSVNLPIVLIIHGYSSTLPNGIVERYANKEVFAIRSYRRGFGGSQGTADDSGRDIYDLYDAVEYIKSHYSQYVDADNINVVGYSNGGGDTYGLVTKFPDYFNSANVFFGMSDYGHDDTYGWWNNGGTSFRTGMQSHIGGTPSQVPDNYYSRAHYLGAKNNPYTHIQLFYDTAETVCPPSHATQYTNISGAEGFTNVVTHFSDTNTTVSELNENFGPALDNWSSLGNGAIDYTRNSSGYIDFTTDRDTTFDVLYKKVTSLRNYAKTDHAKASFKFAITSVDENGAVYFGFRNSADTTAKNKVALIILKSGGVMKPYLRIDYSGTPYDASNFSIQAFSNALATSTTYNFDLEFNSSVLSGTLKDANESTIETKTLGFDGSKGFGGVDSFGIYNHSAGGVTGGMTGTFDDLAVSSWNRWIHGYPQVGTVGAPNITAENYFVPDIVAETWDKPSLNTSDFMFIPGYVKTEKFYLMLGNGDNEAGNLTYDISGDGNSLSNAKTFTVEGLTGSSNLSLDVYNLSADTEYNVVDNDLTNGGSSSSTVTTDSSGMLSYTGYLGSTHSYDIYVEDSTAPIISITSPDSGGTVSADDTIIFSDSEETNPQCSLDNANWVNCASGTTNFSDLTGWNSIDEKDSFTLYVKDTDASNNTGTDQVDNLVKADTIAPVRSGGSPSGELSSSTISATLSLVTSESSACRYSTASETAYDDMTIEFDTADGATHEKNVSNLSGGTSYAYYVRCRDSSGNANDTDYLISFSIAVSSTDQSTDNDADADEDKDFNVQNVKSESTENAITITWKTKHKAKSSVRYGTDKSLKKKKKDSKKEKNHKIVLKDLQSNTKYYFRIKSKDNDNNEDSSKIHSIVTKPIYAQMVSLNQTKSIDQSRSPAENILTPTYLENLIPNACSYTVQSGDSLWTIAKRVYGDAAAYPLIIKGNKDKYPDIGLKLSIGQELILCGNDQTPRNTQNSSDSKDSGQQTEFQNQSQIQLRTKNFHWWNPFSWF